MDRTFTPRRHLVVATPQFRRGHAVNLVDFRVEEHTVTFTARMDRHFHIGTFLRSQFSFDGLQMTLVGIFVVAVRPKDRLKGNALGEGAALMTVTDPGTDGWHVGLHRCFTAGARNGQELGRGGCHDDDKKKEEPCAFYRIFF